MPKGEFVIFNQQRNVTWLGKFKKKQVSSQAPALPLPRWKVEHSKHKFPLIAQRTRDKLARNYMRSPAPWKVDSKHKFPWLKQAGKVKRYIHAVVLGGKKVANA